MSFMTEHERAAYRERDTRDIAQPGVSFRGDRYRNANEARWAAFFHAIGCRANLVRQAFMIEFQPYRPAFHLPNEDTFVDVLPSVIGNNPPYPPSLFAIGCAEHPAFGRQFRDTDENVGKIQEWGWPARSHVADDGVTVNLMCRSIGIAAGGAAYLGPFSYLPCTTDPAGAASIAAQAEHLALQRAEFVFAFYRREWDAKVPPEFCDERRGSFNILGLIDNTPYVRGVSKPAAYSLKKSKGGVPAGFTAPAGAEQAFTFADLVLSGSERSIIGQLGEYLNAGTRHMPGEYRQAHRLHKMTRQNVICVFGDPLDVLTSPRHPYASEEEGRSDDWNEIGGFLDGGGLPIGLEGKAWFRHPWLRCGDLTGLPFPNTEATRMAAKLVREMTFSTNA